MTPTRPNAALRLVLLAVLTSGCAAMPLSLSRHPVSFCWAAMRDGEESVKNNPQVAVATNLAVALKYGVVRIIRIPLAGAAIVRTKCWSGL